MLATGRHAIKRQAGGRQQRALKIEKAKRQLL
jgi:hypothetical protein